MHGVDSKEVFFTLATPLTEIPPQLAELQASIKGDKLVVKYQPSSATMSDILARMHSAGLVIRDISTKEVELEDLFVALTSAA
jgi:ABC-2 type transport system ATP-binding protein